MRTFDETDGAYCHALCKSQGLSPLSRRHITRGQSRDATRFAILAIGRAKQSPSTHVKG